MSEASGSKYTGGSAAPPVSAAAKPPVSSKPAFNPTRSTGGGGGAFNPLVGSRERTSGQGDQHVDEDGWGHDAPPVTRTQLERVQPAYQPTKVDMRELTSQKSTTSSFNDSRGNENTPSDVVKGGYQPIGKVDIAAIRRQAKDSGPQSEDRPTTVKGAYEPVGKVDIAAIKARAQKPSDGPMSQSNAIDPSATGGSIGSGDDRPSLTDRSAAFSTSERLTSLPKPKVSNKFGGGPAFTGTKAPTPGGFEAKAPAPAAPVGTASRTFADQGGKTPAQIWAEKKARERGMSGAGDNRTSSFGGPQSPIESQTSGGGEWKSGYSGKSWAPVQTTHTGKSAGSSIGQQRTGGEPDYEQEQEEEAPTSSAGGIGSIRDRFKDAPPMGAANIGHEPPPLDTTSKPNAGARGIPIPGLPTRPSQQTAEDEYEASPAMPTPPAQPRSPTPPTPSGSPIRIAQPVGRSAAADVEEARDEQFSPPAAMPIKSLDQTVPDEAELEPEPDNSARRAAQAAAASTFGQNAPGAAAPPPHGGEGGKKALVQYDYEKAEDNEIELKEGEYVTNIDMVDDDWWMGMNVHGETGLFPSNYVELVDDEHDEHAAAAAPPSAGSGKTGPTATALYDYEAAEDNEISFPDGAKINNVVCFSSVPVPLSSGCRVTDGYSQEFPDEDWWMGEYGGKSGLFPANYVQLDE